MRNLSYENEFYSQVHSNANHTHFHLKDFALGLGLKQRQKATRKWPIEREKPFDHVTIAKISLTSPIDINVPTKVLLAVETKTSLFQ